MMIPQQHGHILLLTDLTSVNSRRFLGISNLLIGRPFSWCRWTNSLTWNFAATGPPSVTHWFPKHERSGKSHILIIRLSVPVGAKNRHLPCATASSILTSFRFPVFNIPCTCCSHFPSPFKGHRLRMPPATELSSALLAASSPTLLLLDMAFSGDPGADRSQPPHPTFPPCLATRHLWFFCGSMWTESSLFWQGGNPGFAVRGGGIIFQCCKESYGLLPECKWNYK